MNDSGRNLRRAKRIDRLMKGVISFGGLMIIFAVVGILMLALFAAPLRKGGKRACVHTK